jgi:hypothetical protein
VHESKDRAKDASSSEMQRFVHPPSACALWRMRTTFPSSAPFGHPLSSVRDDRGRIPAKGHGPTEVLVPTTPREESRLPEDRDAFHRHDTRGSHFCRRDCSLRPRAGISLTPPTLCSQVGDSVFVGHCKARMRSPADVRAIRECRRLFGLVGTATPGTDDPSVPPSSTGSAVDGDRLPRSHRF